jgi:single-strand DNA-binding protein
VLGVQVLFRGSTVAAFNQVILVGNLTRDPELRSVGESQVCNFALAINERRKKGDEWIDDPFFAECVAWGKLADVVNNYAAKGDPLMVTGKLKTDSWEKDGEKRTKTKILVLSVQLLKGKGERSAPKSEPADAFDDFTPF